MRVAVVVAAMLFCAPVFAQGVKLLSVTNSIRMELIEIPLGESVESQQMLSNFLDEPWTKYETAIATAEKSAASTLTEEFIKQFDAAAALGDLELAESIAVQQKAFKDRGTLPTGKSFESIALARKQNHEKANTQLKKAYDNAIINLTTQNRLAEARIVKDEMLFVFLDANLLHPSRKNGYFRMGDGADVVVTLTKSFKLGKTEVTQGQWKRVMGTEPWRGRDFVMTDMDCPATHVSWVDATEFCKKLTAIERKARMLRGEQYRLPTEAEWEYACRAGTTTAYSFGNDESKLGEYGWFNGNAENAGEKYAHKVGKKNPNPWGLRDMHGNVFEWCSDWYGGKLIGGVDPIGPKEGLIRVFRGGCCWRNPIDCRSATRHYNNPTDRFFDVGFRVARN